ncbi:GNAT family N-acetyltransferase [Undibacterium sp. RTI2.1]|uniref:GNAT family N-acetyltransferase n=1 Tax=unclassified Undibacterium TaxID=2630295 RepID=UPI002AB4F257|nr:MULTISPECIES: GNAT family N-acetyltransferase [unclassified Undibacterium]MDY7537007.1 GNAT family N-acetyltransferase [Undibacterium sp. 5I1]MEB0030456.1 GNAT family N-acetyltransferase [Undibacterium sp. RTI2.1]MEB0115239.1 GNAT family N-acetyltransferase [Undibacterium sp. RTI2.2]MEB0231312.1 GNAT family N-acetyltransferase [Undibacterium sp. 10I3]MEB0258725.1 GNAT family N-acetyltransferase [Undibacterium sp. 5I1]
MHILDTTRLRLRTITLDDAAFYLQLVNEPAYLANIGDKGIRTIEDAIDSIKKGPIDMQERLGFSLYIVESKQDNIAIGMCGLIKRDGLDDVDIGYGFLSAYTGQGLASEAATAVVNYARATIGLPRLVAITAPENAISSRVLEKIGFTYKKIVSLTRNGKTEESKFFTYDFA